MSAVNLQKLKKVRKLLSAIACSLLAGCGGGGGGGATVSITESHTTINGAYSFVSSSLVKSTQRKTTEKSISLPDNNVVAELYNLEGNLIESGQTFSNGSFSLFVPTSKLSETKSNNRNNSVLVIRDKRTGFSVKKIIESIPVNSSISHNVDLQTLANTKILEIRICQLKQIEQAGFNARNFSLGIPNNTVSGNTDTGNQQIRSLMEGPSRKIDVSYISNLNTINQPAIEPVVLIAEEIGKTRTALFAELNQTNMSDFILNEMLNCSIERSSCLSVTDTLFNQIPGKDSLRKAAETIQYENNKRILSTDIISAETELGIPLTSTINNLSNATGNFWSDDKNHYKILTFGKILNSSIEAWEESSGLSQLTPLQNAVREIMRLTENTLSAPLTTENQINDTMVNLCRNIFNSTSLNSTDLSTMTTLALHYERKTGAKLLPFYTGISLLSGNMSSTMSETYQNFAIENIVAILNGMKTAGDNSGLQAGIREMQQIIFNAHPLSHTPSARMFEKPQLSLTAPFETIIAAGNFFSEEITINFNIDKYGIRNTVDLNAEYSASEDSWQQITLTTSSPGTQSMSSPATHQIIWDSVTDLGRTSNSIVRIRLTPSDIFATGETTESAPFRIFNNRAPDLSNVTQPFYYISQNGSRESTDIIYERLSTESSEQTIIGMSASSVIDPDEDTPLTYLWEQTHGPAVTLSNQGSGIFTEFSAPPLSTTTDLKFRLTTTDTKNLQNSKTYTLKLMFRNKRPVPIISGQEQISEIHVGDTITLNGTQSFDPDGHPISYEWLSLQPEKIPTSSIKWTNQSSPTLQVPYHADFSSQSETVSFQLTVRDNHTESLAASTIITFLVIAPQPSAIINPAYENNIYNVGDTITLDGGQSYNYLNKPLVYEWTSLQPDQIPAGSIYFSNRPTAEVKIPNSAYFRTQGQARSISFRLRVYDYEIRELFGEATTSFTVEFQNQPPIVNAGPDFSIDYTDPVNLYPEFRIYGSATDSYERPISYVWEFISAHSVNPASPLTMTTDPLNPATLIIATPKVTSTEQFKKLNFRLTATADDGITSSSASDSVTVTINYIDDNYPVISVGESIVSTIESIDGWYHNRFLLDGTNSTVIVDGQTLDWGNLDFQWEQLSGPAAITGESTSPLLWVTIPNIPPGDSVPLEFSLNVSTRGTEPKTSSARKTVFVSYVNFWPTTVKADSNQTYWPEVQSAESRTPTTIYLIGEYEDPDEVDGQQINFLWEQVSPPSPALDLKNNDRTTSWFASPAVSSDTEFTFRFSVIDGSLGDPQKRTPSTALSDLVTITITYVNTNPTVEDLSASPNNVVNEGETFTITGLADDRETPNSLRLKFYEKLINGEKKFLAGLNSAKQLSYTTTAANDVERADNAKITSYIFEVCDEDEANSNNRGILCTDSEINITRIFLNQAPIALLSNPVTTHVYENNRENVTEEGDIPSAIILNGGNSYDPDNDYIMSYQWRLLDGNGQETDSTYAILQRPSNYPEYQRKFIPKDICSDRSFKAQLTVLDQGGLSSPATTIDLKALFWNRPVEITAINKTAASNKKSIYLTAEAFDPDLESTNASLRCTDQTIQYTWRLTDSNHVLLNNSSLGQGCLFLNIETAGLTNPNCNNRFKLTDNDPFRNINSSAVSYIITDPTINTDNMQTIYLELMVYDYENSDEPSALRRVTIGSADLSRNRIPSPSLSRITTTNKPPKIDIFHYKRKIEKLQARENSINSPSGELFISIAGGQNKIELHHFPEIFFPTMLKKGDLNLGEYHILLENGLFLRLKEQSEQSERPIFTEGITDFYANEESLFTLNQSGFQKSTPEEPFYHIPHGQKIIPIYPRPVFILDGYNKLFAINSTDEQPLFISNNVLNIKKCRNNSQLLLLKTNEIEIIDTEALTTKRRIQGKIEDAACNEQEILFSQELQLHKTLINSSENPEKITTEPLTEPISIEAINDIFIVSQKETIKKIQAGKSIDLQKELEEIFIPSNAMNLAMQGKNTIILYSDFFIRKYPTGEYETIQNPEKFQKYLIDGEQIYARTKEKIYLLNEKSKWNLLKNVTPPDCHTGELISHGRFFCQQEQRILSLNISENTNNWNTIYLDSTELRRGSKNTILLRSLDTDLVLDVENQAILRTLPANKSAINCNSSEFDISPLANTDMKALYFNNQKALIQTKSGIAVYHIDQQKEEYLYYFPHLAPPLKTNERPDHFNAIFKDHAISLPNPCIFVN